MCVCEIALYLDLFKYLYVCVCEIALYLDLYKYVYECEIAIDYRFM